MCDTDDRTAGRQFFRTQYRGGNIKNFTEHRAEFFKTHGVEKRLRRP